MFAVASSLVFETSGTTEAAGVVDSSELMNRFEKRALSLSLSGNIYIKRVALLASCSYSNC